MDYKGMYHDLSEMSLRAMSEANRLDSLGRNARADTFDSFWAEVQDFMDEISRRAWHA